MSRNSDDCACDATEDEISLEQIQALYLNSARDGSIELLKEFIQAGMDVNYQNNKEGYTPLILSTYNGQEEATLYLLEMNANPNIRDNTGSTALTGVAFKGYTKIARLLINAGADVNTQNNLGRSPLIFSVLFKKQEMVELLIDTGANPFLEDGEGLSAFKLAERQGNKALTKLFSTYKK